MLDQSIDLLPTRERKIVAIREKLERAIKDGSFTYTDLILCGSVLMTYGFEIMDGVVVDGDLKPHPLSNATLDPPEPVRLVAIDPTYHIRSYAWHATRIPGTDKVGPAHKKAIDYGNDVTIEDRFDRGRIPRQILVREGWPMRQLRSAGNDVGRVVEWKWLERVSTGPDATDEYRELYATLKQRIDSARGPTNERSAPAKGAAGARP